ncbi:MAG: hypothetical protein ACOWYE_15045 [Desulfatiglandales bacterium]
MSRTDREEAIRVGGRMESLCPEQIRHIRETWNKKALEEIAMEVDASLEAVRNFAMSHYLYFNYLREAEPRP